jgi:transcriptional regulator with XRE-family HTH domain
VLPSAPVAHVSIYLFACYNVPGVYQGPFHLSTAKAQKLDSKRNHNTTLSDQPEEMRIMGKSYGEFLRALRESRQLTLRQVDERVQVSHGYLSQVERGERGIPNLKTLKRLAEAYGVTVTELVDAAEKEAAGIPLSTRSPEPQADFVLKALESLSHENKQHLLAYLEFLLYKEQKEVKRATKAERLLQSLAEAKTNGEKGTRQLSRAGRALKALDKDKGEAS